MSAAQADITARERLAQSRGRLLHLVADTARRPTVVEVHGKAPVVPMLAATLLARWWHRHPARVMLALARPALQDCAARQPMQLLAYGAGAGCLLVLLHAHKFLSAGLMLTLLAKGSVLPASVARIADAQGDHADSLSALAQAPGNRPAPR